MKARQRAGAVWDQFTLDLMFPNGDRPPVTIQRIILAIEQAIIAAEGESAKAEREACANTARLAKEEAERIIPTTDEERAYQSGAIYIASGIEGHIRARS